MVEGISRLKEFKNEANLVTFKQGLSVKQTCKLNKKKIKLRMSFPGSNLNKFDCITNIIHYCSSRGRLRACLHEEKPGIASAC